MDYPDNPDTETIGRDKYLGWPYSDNPQSSISSNLQTHQICYEIALDNSKIFEENIRENKKDLCNVGML